MVRSLTRESGQNIRTSHIHPLACPYPKWGYIRARQHSNKYSRMSRHMYNMHSVIHTFVCAHTLKLSRISNAHENRCSAQRNHIQPHTHTPYTIWNNWLTTYLTLTPSMMMCICMLNVCTYTCKIKTTGTLTKKASLMQSPNGANAKPKSAQIRVRQNGIPFQAVQSCRCVHHSFAVRRFLASCKPRVCSCACVFIIKLVIYSVELLLQAEN